MPERLFRDEEGAALERVAHLEDENARLRAELEGRGAPAPPSLGRRPEADGATKVKRLAMGAMWLSISAMVTVGFFFSHKSPPQRAPQIVVQVPAPQMADDRAWSAPASDSTFGQAEEAVRRIDVQHCAMADGPRGNGLVQVSFEPSGAMTSAVVTSAPFVDTAVGACVAGSMRMAHIPAFDGGPLRFVVPFTVK